MENAETWATLDTRHRTKTKNKRRKKQTNKNQQNKNQKSEKIEQNA